MSRIAVFDRDSTLSDTRQRWHLRPAVNADGNWDEYHAAGHRDAWCPDRYRAGAEAWLRAHDLPFRNLRMRTPNDGILSGPYKAAYIEYLISRGHHVVLAVEDWPADADAIEALGLAVPVVCINPRYMREPLCVAGKP